MRARILIVATTAILACTGCWLEEGLRQGLEDGAAAAAQTLIETPITVLVDALLGAE